MEEPIRENPIPYLVWLKMEPLIKEENYADDFSEYHEEGKKANEIEEKKNEVIQFASKFGIEKNAIENIFVLFDVGFSMLLTPSQNKTIVEDEMVDFVDIDMNMQGGRPVLQGRPILQASDSGEAKYYDTYLRTSCAVKLAGGPRDVGSYNEENKIWVIDTGIDKNHPDLKVNTVLSKSFVSEEPDATVDISGHGTHCAGIAAGKATDSTFYGMNGVSSGAELVSLKVLNSYGVGKFSYLKKALEHVLIHAKKDHVVMICLGAFDTHWWDNSFKKINNLIVIMTNFKGIYLAMSAGNDFGDANLNYPGSYSFPEKAITVASVEFNCNYITGFAPYSNFGTAARWAAPGSNVFSTFPGNAYEVMSGTSMACALVAGIIHARVALPNTTEYITYNGLDYQIARL